MNALRATTALTPIPNDALDDRLGIVGTAGSGKTYNSMAAVERILDTKGRVIIPDPLGVWYGLRLKADGRSESPYSIVIFGGPHGDLPINEHAGALIGETVAGMAESAIIDLSEFGTKAGERRFMLAFLTALYRHASKEPVHLVFDEADMWAPQSLLDKEGEAAKLLGMMETVVRRGRIKVGWRKRVIQIDWSDSAIQTDAETLFPDEDVTKGGRTIHAWGVDKARAYVARLLEAA